MNPAASFSRLSEDWQATLIGLILVAVIGSGILGPGGQNVSFKAAAGESASAVLRPLSGWQVSATLGGEKISPASPPVVTTAGDTLILVCQDDTLSTGEISAVPGGIEPAPEGRTRLVLVNNCAQEVIVTYRTSPLIPWPVFNLFAR